MSATPAWLPVQRVERGRAIFVNCTETEHNPARTFRAGVLILYEYPLNERVRAFLRLEDLFDRMGFFVERDTSHDHHAALLALFEVLEVCSRGELKSDILQELERQKQVLSGYREVPGVNLEVLNEVIHEVERAFQALMDSPGKTGQHLRDNEWLSAIRSRAIIPGGTCEFDLPSYHAWLNRPVAQRRNDLLGWLTPLKPMADALHLVLKLLREGGRPADMVAAQGVYQQDAKGKTWQLLRLWVDETRNAVPEISANKYVLHIRFTQAGIVARPSVIDADVPFRIALCNF